MDYGKIEVQNSSKYEQGRNIIYVAITRVIRNLRVTYIDNFEEVQDGSLKVGKVWAGLCRVVHVKRKSFFIVERIECIEKLDIHKELKEEFCYFVTISGDILNTN